MENRNLARKQAGMTAEDIKLLSSLNPVGEKKRKRKGSLESVIRMANINEVQQANINGICIIDKKAILPYPLDDSRTPRFLVECYKKQEELMIVPEEDEEEIHSIVSIGQTKGFLNPLEEQAVRAVLKLSDEELKVFREAELRAMNKAFTHDNTFPNTKNMEMREKLWMSQYV